jgi:hypothetical protein
MMGREGYSSPKWTDYTELFYNRDFGYINKLSLVYEIEPGSQLYLCLAIKRYNSYYEI